MGPTTKDLVVLDWPEPEVRGDEVHGELVYIDRFGNVITNIPECLVPRHPHLVAVAAGRHRFPIREFYAAVPPGSPVAVVGSSGFLELALNGGSATNRLRLTMGTHVRVGRDRP